MDALNPSPALLSKLASITVHAGEMLSADGHPFDAAAIESLLADHEVQLWLDAMAAMALTPVERRKG
jgi:hypothetical protein